MSGQVREWLPLGALDGPRLRDLVEAAVAGWSGRWFARRPAAAAGFEACAGAAAEPGWRRRGSGLAFAAGAAETAGLADLALGADIAQLVLSEVDRDIVDRFTGRLVLDLAAEIERALGLAATGEDDAAIGDPLDGDGGLRFHAADAHQRPLVRFALPRTLLAPLCKAALPPCADGPAMAPLLRAVGASPIEIGTRLGRAAVPLGEFAALAVGDVLILDRPVEDGAELVLAPAALAFGRGAIDAAGPGLSLVLSHPGRDT
jgi:flagellar motor switch/type III secretory pathway protein FliN